MAWTTLLGCQGEGPHDTTAPFVGSTMGTTYSVQVADSSLRLEQRDQIGQLIEQELEAVDGAMSTYRDDSELMRLNRWTDPTPFKVSGPTFEVLTEAIRISRVTGGAFDITIGPLVNALGFGPEPVDGLPHLEDLVALRERTGSDKIELEPASTSVIKARADLFLDLSGIAKGYAVDRIATALDRLGYADYFVEIGGEVRARGLNHEGHVWKVGIERATLDRRELQRILPLRDTAMATSGDYRNYREIDGRRISHILDPRTAGPVVHNLAAVTVLHPSCATADALATALMVLGPDEGLRLAEARGWATLMLVRDQPGRFSELRSAAFEQSLVD